jgi:hypothetical protein
MKWKYYFNNIHTHQKREAESEKMIVERYRMFLDRALDKKVRLLFHFWLFLKYRAFSKAGKK